MATIVCLHISGPPCRKALNWKGAGPGPRYNVVIVQPSRADMEAALRLVQQRRLKPIIDKVLPLEQAR